MARVQLARMQAATPNLTLAAVIFTLASIKGGDFAVKVKMDYVDGGGVHTVHDVVDAGGKVKVFRDADDFIKAAAKARILDSTTEATVFKFENMDGLEPAPYTGDLLAKAQRDLVSIQKQIDAATATSTRLGQEIALFPVNPSVGELALKTEKEAQKTSVDALKTWLDAEHARITAIINP